MPEIEFLNYFWKHTYIGSIYLSPYFEVGKCRHWWSESKRTKETNRPIDEVGRIGYNSLYCLLDAESTFDFSSLEGCTVRLNFGFKFFVFSSKRTYYRRREMIPLGQKIWLICLLRLWPFRIGIRFTLLFSSTSQTLTFLCNPEQ